MEDTSFETRMRVQHPELIQLYSFPTPNGIKISVMLEEIIELRRNKGSLSSSNTEGESEQVLLYEPHAVNIRTGENRLGWFYHLGFKTGKVPGIIDPQGPGNSPITLFESGAILKYLAKKYDELLPKDCRLCVESIKWLFFGSATVSTQFKLFGFYYKNCSHNIQCKYLITHSIHPHTCMYIYTDCVDRYTKEVHRLLHIMELQLRSHPTSIYMIGGNAGIYMYLVFMSIASISILIYTLV